MSKSIVDKLPELGKLRIMQNTWVDRLIDDKLGGVASAAELLDLPYMTVKNWKLRRSISDKKKKYILQISARKGIKIELQDFFDPIRTPQKTGATEAAP